MGKAEQLLEKFNALDDAVYSASVDTETKNIDGVECTAEPMSDDDLYILKSYLADRAPGDVFEMRVSQLASLIAKADKLAAEVRKLSPIDDETLSEVMHAPVYYRLPYCGVLGFPEELVLLVTKQGVIFSIECGVKTASSPVPFVEMRELGAALMDARDAIENAQRTGFIKQRN